ncbi:MAG: HAD-IB family hydrolase [Flavobacteriales bacterium]|nr:HAD-IB family hydrolase [Flavobacteriales bacterium]
MSAKQNLVIFDFCDTLINGQSVNLFLNYLINQQIFLYRIYLKFRKTFASYFIKGSKKKKEFILKPFKGKNRSYFLKNSHSFFINIIQNNLHQKIIAILKSHQEKNDRIIVVSGGFSIYLNEFEQYYNVKSIGTELEFSNDIFLGKIKNKECLNVEKINRLLELEGITIQELANATFYTDHKDDLPLLEIVKNGNIIKNKQDISWAKSKFNVITI